MPDLTSRQNPRVKLARALHQRKTRQESGLFLVEGLRHLGDLYESGYEVEFVLHGPNSLTGGFGQALIERFRTRGVEVLSTTDEILDQVSGRSHALGAVAVARQKPAQLAELKPAEMGTTVAIVSPQDPGNLGTILRTMDAVRAGALVLLDGGADPWQPAAVRASMGMLFWHPVVQVGFGEFAAWAAAQGLHIYGTSAHGSVDYRDIVDYAQPNVLLLGSEREGLSPEQAAVCEALIRLPMRGRSTSLNLAVAAGIFLYTMR